MKFTINNLSRTCLVLFLATLTTGQNFVAIGNPDSTAICAGDQVVDPQSTSCFPADTVTRLGRWRRRSSNAKRQEDEATDNVADHRIQARMNRWMRRSIVQRSVRDTTAMVADAAPAPSTTVDADIENDPIEHRIARRMENWRKRAQDPNNLIKKRHDDDDDDVATKATATSTAAASASSTASSTKKTKTKTKTKTSSSSSASASATATSSSANMATSTSAAAPSATATSSAAQTSTPAAPAPTPAPQAGSVDLPEAMVKRLRVW